MERAAPGITESRSLGAFERRVDVALREPHRGERGGAGWAAGLADLTGPFQPKGLAEFGISGSPAEPAGAQPREPPLPEPAPCPGKPQQMVPDCQKPSGSPARLCRELPPAAPACRRGSEGRGGLPGFGMPLTNSSEAARRSASTSSTSASAPWPASPCFQRFYFPLRCLLLETTRAMQSPRLPSLG